jgi:hypothetical protein
MRYTTEAAVAASPDSIINRGYVSPASLDLFTIKTASYVYHNVQITLIGITTTAFVRTATTIFQECVRSAIKEQSGTVSHVSSAHQASMEHPILSRQLPLQQSQLQLATLQFSIQHQSHVNRTPPSTELHVCAILGILTIKKPAMHVQHYPLPMTAPNVFAPMDTFCRLMVKAVSNAQFLSSLPIMYACVHLTLSMLVGFVPHAPTG